MDPERPASDAVIGAVNVSAHETVDMLRQTRILPVLLTAATVLTASALGSNANLTTNAAVKARLELLGMSADGPFFALAVAARQRPLVELALAAGADVNAVDEAGRTPLLVATLGKQWDLVQALLKAGANPNLASATGVTPLMAAAAHGHLPTVKDLVSKGASEHSVDTENRTALHYAVASRQSEVTTHLLAKTENLPAPCANGDTLGAYALQSRDWKIVEAVLPRESGSLEWDASSRALLDEALRARDAKRVQMLLTRHTQAPTPEGRAQPLLAYALAGNDLSLAKFLLECGADPNAPLATPAEKEFLELIPAKTVRHYLSSEPGMTPLMLAAGLGNKDAVELLLEKGASRNAATKSKHKLVPLYFAAWANAADCLQVLLGNAPKPEDLRIEISLASQKASLIRSGVPVFTTGISSGRSGYSTPAGQFVVTDKRHNHISSIYKVKMPFFMRLSCKDFGLHQGHVPNYPASHGCIRLPTAAARKLFQDVPIGTLVTIAN